MVTIQLYLAFGYGEEAEVWGSSVDIQRLFKLGEKTQVMLKEKTEDAENLFTIDCEVAYIDYTDEGEPYVFLFHEDLINDTYRELLEGANWMHLDEEDEAEILDVLDYAPPVASLHDLILVVGDYTSVDKEGYPDKVQVWHRVIEPDDSSVPVFGEKFYSHVILSNGEQYDSESEEFEEYDEDSDPEPTEEQLEQIAELLENPEMLELDDYVFEPGTEPIVEVVLGAETIDLDEPGNPEDGYPVLTFYTAKIGYGEANVGVWCKSIEPYTELDMIADGWQLLPKEALNLQEFRLKERVELALNTFVTMVEDERGTRYIERYEIIDTNLVTEEQFPLIPPALQEMSSGINELTKDFENIDSFLNDWLLETSEEDEDENQKPN